MATASIDVSEQLFIGMMSGTSLNSIDCGLFDFSDEKVTTLATLEYALPNKLKNELLALCAPGNDEIHRMARADRRLGELFAEATNTLLQTNGYKSQDIAAIGSHGQTIRHYPESNAREPAYSLQIGDPNTIVSRTNITTVSDFRRRDIALGGQGAPLAPAFHAYAFKSEKVDRYLVNIGGISNLTFLPSSGDVLGFDTGPGNVLMDTWIKQCRGLEFDENGAWATAGKINQELLTLLLNEPYLRLQPPKSTGRELFNAEWLHKRLSAFPNSQPEDVMATLAEFTATTITLAVESLGGATSGVYLCGGGTHNTFLKSRLQHHLRNTVIEPTSKLGIHEDWVEAATFAWLAKNAVEGKTVDFSTITGSRCAYPCGTICLS